MQGNNVTAVKADSNEMAYDILNYYLAALVIVSFFAMLAHLIEECIEYGRRQGKFAMPDAQISFTKII